MSTCRALLAAPPGPLRDSLRALLLIVPQVESVCEAEDASSALRIILEQRPALVLLDYSLPGNEVLFILNKARGNSGQSHCLVLVDDLQQQQQAQRAGADVALPKGFPAARLYEAIEALLAKLAVDQELPGQLQSTCHKGELHGNDGDDLQAGTGREKPGAAA